MKLSTNTKLSVPDVIWIHWVGFDLGEGRGDRLVGLQRIDVSRCLILQSHSSNTWHLGSFGCVLMPYAVTGHMLMRL